MSEEIIIKNMSETLSQFIHLYYFFNYLTVQLFSVMYNYIGKRNIR